jgi:hypothetical protein
LAFGGQAGGYLRSLEGRSTQLQIRLDQVAFDRGPGQGPRVLERTGDFRRAQVGQLNDAFQGLPREFGGAGQFQEERSAFGLQRWIAGGGEGPGQEKPGPSVPRLPGQGGPGKGDGFVAVAALVAERGGEAQGLGRHFGPPQILIQINLGDIEAVEGQRQFHRLVPFGPGIIIRAEDPIPIIESFLPAVVGQHVGHHPDGGKFPRVEMHGHLQLLKGAFPLIFREGVGRLLLHRLGAFLFDHPIDWNAGTADHDDDRQQDAPAAGATRRTLG